MTADAKPFATESTPDFETIYEECLPLLIAIAVEQFSVPNSDAQTLAHEVFLAYLLKREEIRDARAFLVSAIYYASKHYLRQEARHQPLPGDDSRHLRIVRIGEIISARIAACEALQCMTPRCRLVLALRYLEGFTSSEIASELRTTERYARNLIARCLKQARRRYVEERRS